MEITDADQKILKILISLFSKGYLLTEISTYLAENSIIKPLLYKVNRHINCIPKSISYRYKITDNIKYFDNINEFNVKKTYCILIFKLNDILKKYKKKKELKERDYNNIEAIEGDIEEIKKLFNGKNATFTISMQDKNNSVLYKILTQ